MMKQGTAYKVAMKNMTGSPTKKSVTYVKAQ